MRSPYSSDGFPAAGPTVIPQTGSRTTSGAAPALAENRPVIRVVMMVQGRHSHVHSYVGSDRNLSSHWKVKRFFSRRLRPPHAGPIRKRDGGG